MSRLPFDPDRADGAGPSPDDTRGGADAMSVSALAALIKGTLEQRLPSSLRVVGQVSNLAARNHWYFSLKDEQSVVSCVAWASAAQRFGFVPNDGDEVVATGHVSHYPPQGRTQLYVSALAPVGAGALQLRFEAMCRELRELGYFEVDRKKPLPALPRRIAVITSAGGAAVQDVIATAAQRCRAVGLLVVNVRVQGDGAAAEVAHAIRRVDRARERLGVDAILVTRGGGSMEDLWAFNERVVADAAYACTLPVVAAIGHESDTTVIELVADRRAATPTQAAMHLVPDASELLRQCGHLSDRLELLVRRRVEGARERLTAQTRDLGRVLRARVGRDHVRLERLAGRLAALRPEALLAGRRERLALLTERLRRVSAARLDVAPRVHELHRRLHAAVTVRAREERRRLEALERQAAAVDPRAVLRRGFSYTTDGAGALVKSVGDVGAGDALVTHVADGTIDSTVGRTGRRPAGPARSTAKRPASGAAAPQMDLFGEPG